MASIQFCPRCGTAVTEQLKFGKLRPVCPACDHIYFANPKVAAAVFIEGQDQAHRQILLVKRSMDPGKGKWALPAGFIDFGESPTDAAIREAAEETGLNVEIMRLIDVMFGSNDNTIVITYAARVIGGTLSAADDAEEVRWFGADELPELAFQSTHTVVAAWLRA